MEILRTASQGCYQLKSNAWGRFLAPALDPLADTVITDEQMNGFELNADIHKIPHTLWQRWILLCIEMTKRDSRNLEVSCRILRNEADPSLYRIVVPEQSVTVASVRVDSFDKAIDIETGEVLLQWPPEGWRPCGSSHSHNTMDSFFSGTDDAYELGDPGLHIVVGNINAQTGVHTLKASVTANQRRFLIQPDAVLQDEFETDVTYHASVLNIIQIPTNNIISSSTGFTGTWPSVTYQYYSNPDTTYTSSAMTAGNKQGFSDSIDCILTQGKEQGFSELEILTQLKTQIDDRIEDETIWNNSHMDYSDPFHYEDSLAWTV